MKREESTNWYFGALVAERDGRSDGGSPRSQIVGSSCRHHAQSDQSGWVGEEVDESRAPSVRHGAIHNRGPRVHACAVNGTAKAQDRGNPSSSALAE